MNWIEDVKKRLKDGNQILFTRDSQYLQDLMLLFEDRDRRILVLWALDLAGESAGKLEEKYPGERRPAEAVTAARDWSRGKMKMRQAQRKILDCHAFAKEIDSREDIAVCHAVGQACAVVHSAGHAAGYPMYDLTSNVRRCGVDHCAGAVEARKREYIDRLLYWSEHLEEYTGEWARFLLR